MNRCRCSRVTQFLTLYVEFGARKKVAVVAVIPVEVGIDYNIDIDRV
jgi:hypothetical protein